MTREIDAAAITASLAQNVFTLVMGYLDFDPDPIYFHTGVGTLTWDGNDYLGVGGFGKISNIQEDLDTGSHGMTLALSGVDTDNISIALNTYYQGRLAIIYLAFLNEDFQLAIDPMILFQGRMDNMVFDIGKEAEIQLNVESPEADWDKPAVSRYNNADQQARFPGDKGLEFVEQSVRKEITWGA